MDRAVHFWSEVLGFPVVEQWKREPGMRGYQAEQFGPEVANVDFTAICPEIGK
jgi:catechol 2,3-dioxygenase-like lactoylglutathione lyase family enzyme